MEINIHPIAFVKNTRETLSDDFWGDIVSEIELADDIPTESLDGIEKFSHIEIVFFFHLAANPTVYKRHPRGNPYWPEVGIFAQRNKDRPNKLGITTAKLIKREGRRLFVTHFDGINGTPVVDIKPVIREFLINKHEVTEPEWAVEMLKNYWK